jgi:uncharacterized protein (DUF1501 family)
MINRREFLKNSALITSGSFLVPQFLSAGKNSFENNYHGRKLVVIQLGGGNDGLNTIIPYRNDLYYKYRPNISIKGPDVRKLTDELGFNPSMKKLHSLFDQGELAIVNNVGYPNPDRSHFRSMDIWHSASDSSEYIKSGWLGRTLDAVCTTDAKPYFGIESGEILSLAMKGNKMKGMAVENINRLHRSSQDPFLSGISKAHQDHGTPVDYLYKTYNDARDSVLYLKEKLGLAGSKSSYPKNPLSNSLAGIGQLIKAGVETQIFYASTSGFDTHARQVAQQNNLLKQVSEALSTFVDDLKQSDQFNSTLILVFSEFGRRVKENGSFGTDHGTANNIWLLGGKLKKAGFQNEAPDLDILDQDDLKYSIDFRSIYATILDNWLEVESREVLGRRFPILSFI